MITAKHWHQLNRNEYDPISNARPITTRQIPNMLFLCEDKNKWEESIS